MKYRHKLTGAIAEAIQWNGQNNKEVEDFTENIWRFCDSPLSDGCNAVQVKDSKTRVAGVKLYLKKDDYVFFINGDYYHDFPERFKIAYEPMINENNMTKEELKKKLMLDYRPTIEANKIQFFELLTKQMNDIYKAKNQDYADSFGKSFRKDGILGIRGAAKRIGDKFNRIEEYSDNVLLNVISGNNSDEDCFKVEDEKIEDTLMDMANYCLMTIIELKLLKQEQECTK